MMCTDLSSLIGIFDPQRGERGPEGTESIEQSLKESEEIRTHLKSNYIIYTGPFGPISVKNGQIHFSTSILDPMASSASLGSSENSVKLFLSDTYFINSPFIMHPQFVEFHSIFS